MFIEAIFVVKIVKGGPLVWLGRVGGLDGSVVGLDWEGVGEKRTNKRKIDGKNKTLDFVEVRCALGLDFM